MRYELSLREYHRSRYYHPYAGWGPVTYQLDTSEGMGTKWVELSEKAKKLVDPQTAETCSQFWWAVLQGYNNGILAAIKQHGYDPVNYGAACEVVVAAVRVFRVPSDEEITRALQGV